MATFPSVYPIYDSLKNFKIVVRLERVITASGGSIPSFPAYHRQRTLTDEDGSSVPTYQFSRSDADAEVEEYTFGWQEKVLCRREFSLYADEGNCKTVLQKKYNKDIAQMRQNGRSPGKRLFSYIEGDEYSLLEEKVDELSIDKGQTSDLSEKMTAVRRRRVAPGQQGGLGFGSKLVVNAPSAEAIKKSRNCAHTVQTMYLMADLGTKDAEVRDVKDEFVLCVLKLFNENQLSIEPDFNHQINRAYKIESRVGVFQYTLEDVSTKLTLEDIDEQKKAQVSLAEYKAGMLKAQVGTDFDVPEEGVLKVVVLGEIVEAKNFEYDGLFVHYFVDLPKGWYSSSDKPLFGVTQICRTRTKNQENVAYFSFPFECSLSFNMNSFEYEQGHLPKWPQVLFEVMSVDSWKRFRVEGYGYTTLPTLPGCYERSIPTWRPTDGTPQSELRRYFVGSATELDEIDFTSIPKTVQGGKLSKFGFQTLNSGTVRFKFSTIHQCSAGIGLHSSILSILEAFQRARQRMISVRENIMADQGLFPA